LSEVEEEGPTVMEETKEKASVWYSRRPRVQKLAMSATRKDLERLRAVAGWLWPRGKDPGDPICDMLAVDLMDVLMEIDLVRKGVQFVPLGIDDQTPDAMHTAGRASAVPEGWSLPAAFGRPKGHA
jgi:hypothetical protein